MIAALFVALAVVSVQDPVPQPAAEKITEIRVHGNATLSDDMVIGLAGIALGGALDQDGLTAIEKRLKDSGRFDEVQVRKRYRTLAMDEVAVVLVVHEKPGTSPSGEPPSAMKRLRGRLMFFPIFDYDDGYGFTYGGQTAVVDAFGKGTRVSVPLSWGGTRRAAIEADRTFKSGPLTRLTGSFGITQRENPFYEIDDRRTELGARAERRLFKVATLGADITRTALTFEPSHDDFWSPGADATLDTRGSMSYPVDAVFGSVRWLRLNPIGSTTFAADAIDKYRVRRARIQAVVRPERHRAARGVRHGLGAAAALRTMAARRVEPAWPAGRRARRRSAAARIRRAAHAVFLAAQRGRPHRVQHLLRRGQGRGARREDR